MSELFYKQLVVSYPVEVQVSRTEQMILNG